MTSTQEAKFLAASGIDPGDLRLSIASIALMFLFLYVSWVTWTALVAWRHGHADLFGLLTTMARGAVALMLVGWFVR